MQEEKRSLFDRQLLFIMVLLAVISLVAIAGAGPLISSTNYKSSPFELVTRQGQWFIISAIFVFAIYKLTNDRIYTMAWIFYGLFFVLLILLLVDRIVSPYISFFPGNHFIPFASTINGATLWYLFPGIGSMQPTEFMKVAIIVVLACIIKNHNSKYTFHTTKSDLILIRKAAFVVLPPAAVNFLLDDTGVTLIILVSVFFMLFVSGIEGKWFAAFGIILGVVVAILAYLYIFKNSTFTEMMKWLRIERLSGWLDPEGTYTAEGGGYQLFNALLAMGSAPLFGHGFGSSIIYFPEAQTDFIFAVIVQDFGLIGGLVTIVSILLLDIKLITTALKTRDERDKYLIMGMVGMLLFQQFWNVGMIMGVVPITGITLPFISYGGSSLLSYMIIIGMTFDIIRKHRIESSKTVFD